jgi:hypothetical protein
LVAPAWRPLALRGDERLKRYMSDRVALVDGGAGKADLLVESLEPLRVRGSVGEVGQVDLSLVGEEGGYSPRRSGASVRLPRHLGAGFDVAGVAVAPGGADVVADVVAGKTFYPSFAAGTDLWATPLVDGLEIYLQLRSAQSPERFPMRFSVPAGARLQESAVLPGAAEVVRGERRIALVRPPMAWDADDYPVPVSYEVTGDALTVVVPHRAGDYLYPLLVDPAIVEDQRSWRDNGSLDYLGWRYETNSNGRLGYSSGAGALGSGLYVFDRASTAVNVGDVGQWRFDAPGTAFVMRAEFARVSHDSGRACVREAIWSNVDNWYEPGAWMRDGETQALNGSPWPEVGACANLSGLSDDTKIHCTSTTCGQHGTPGNSALFRHEVWNSGADFDRYTYMGGARIYLSDIDRPNFQSYSLSGANGWMQDATATVNATVTDTGLGVKKVYVDSPDVPGWSGGSDEHGCRGDRLDRCPGERTVGLSFSTETLPDGDVRVRTVAQDVVGNDEARMSQVKIDQTPPDVYASGTLWRDGATLAGQSYDLTVEAVDGDSDAPNSGVASITVDIDGQAVPPDTPPQACSAEDSCSLSATWAFQASEYEEGAHTVTITAVDRVGITSEESVVVDVVHIPTLAPNTKSLDSASSLRVDGAGIGDEAGSAVATLGDVNGDGIDDFAVGAPHADNNARPESGSVYVIYGGGPGGTLDLASLGSRGYRIDGAVPGHLAGTAVAAAGDLNGDGVGDLLIGAPHLGSDRGHIYAVFGGTGTGLDLASLGGRGFTVHGPSNDLSLLPGERRFGASLAGVRGGFGRTFGDVNGDDLDDFVVGSSADGMPGAFGFPIGRVHSGAAYVIFGKNGPGEVNVGSLQSTAGFPIYGAATGHRAGHAAAVVGDVNADNLADIAITAPGANHLGRANGGTAYVVFGKEGGQPVDLAAFGPSDGFPIYGGEGNRLGSSLASAGDFNNDGYDDIAVGGHGATVVLGKGFDADPVDTSAMTVADGYRIVAPAGSSYDDTVVSNAEDLNGDALPDLGIAFPRAAGGGTTAAGESRLLFSQRGAADEPLPAVTYLSSPLPGQLGTTLHGSQQAQSAGVALDGYDGGDNGAPGLVVGAPGSSANTRARSGSVYYVPESQASAHRRANTECIRRSGRAYNDYEDNRECRRTDAGNEDHQPWPSVCGANPKSRCTHGAVGEFQDRRAVAYESFRKPLRKDVATGEAEVEHPGIGVQSAWPLYDSVGEVVGYIRQTGFRPRQFAVWNDQRQYIGETYPHSKRHPVRWILESRGCMNPKSGDAGDYAIVFLEANDGSRDTGRGGLSIRAFISRSAFQEHSFWPNVTNDEGIDYYWTPCGIRRFPKRRSADALQTTTTYSVPELTVWNQDAGTGDAYQSWNAGNKCEKNQTKFPEGQYTASHPACGAPYENNTWPHGSDPVRYPPMVMMPGGTNGVRQGGLARAIFKVGTNGASVRLRDRIRYIDRNVPCGHYRVANWQVIRLPDGDGDKRNDIFAWAIRRVGDNQAPATPSAPAGPRQC